MNRASSQVLVLQVGPLIPAGLGLTPLSNWKSRIPDKQGWLVRLHCWSPGPERCQNSRDGTQR